MGRSLLIHIPPLPGGLFSRVNSLHSSMSIAYDFKLLSSGVQGMSLVMPMNEEAFWTITGEFDMTVLPNGSVPLDNTRLSEFVHLAECAHMACDF
jgi:hypothetical protein